MTTVAKKPGTVVLQRRFYLSAQTRAFAQIRAANSLNEEPGVIVMVSGGVAAHLFRALLEAYPIGQLATRTKVRIVGEGFIW